MEGLDGPYARLVEVQREFYFERVSDSVIHAATSHAFVPAAQAAWHHEVQCQPGRRLTLSLDMPIGAVLTPHTRSFLCG